MLKKEGILGQLQYKIYISKILKTMMILKWKYKKTKGPIKKDWIQGNQ